jgi:hypothetical protein
MEVSGQLHAPSALPPGKEPWDTLDRRLGGSQNRYGYGGEEKNSQPLLGLKPPDHPARSPAVYHWAVLASITKRKTRFILRVARGILSANLYYILMDMMSKRFQWPCGLRQLSTTSCDRASCVVPVVEQRGGLWNQKVRSGLCRKCFVWNCSVIPVCYTLCYGWKIRLWRCTVFPHMLFPTLEINLPSFFDKAYRHNSFNPA